MLRRAAELALLSGLWWCAADAAEPPAVPDFYSTEVARCRALLHSRVAAYRLEGIEGLNWLKEVDSEDELLRLTHDDDDLVRREATYALTRWGTARSLPRLIEILTDTDRGLAQLAHLGLQRMTAQSFGLGEGERWRDWWQATTREAKVAALLTEVGNLDHRTAALMALRHLAEPDDEARLLALLQRPPTAPLSPQDWRLAMEGLSRVATAKSLPLLAKVASVPDCAYALGRLGGPVAEAALLKAPKSETVWLNLDRLHCAQCGPFAVELLNNFGLVSFRSTPDEVHLDPRPGQRVAANLLLRSGEAPRLVDLLLCELEGKSKAATVEPALQQMLVAMRPELKPGFRRADSTAMSRCLGALPHLARDPQLVPRLLPLLDHPAIVPRVYVALTLGWLHAEAAVPKLVAAIEAPYPFNEITALASGKHFARSQTVRWKGFFCLALGRLGGAAARKALERFALDQDAPRDVRYGAVAGLGFLCDPATQPTLQQAAEADPILMVRRTAHEALREIELRQEAAP